MKSNKKLVYVIIGFLLLTFSACEDYLKEDNYSSVVADELYATQSGYEGLINSCYSSLRDIYGQDIWVFCAGTDMYVEGYNSQPEGLSEYKSLSATDIYVTSFYQNLYKSIQLCNTAIFYNNITEENEKLPLRLAEARFIRALNYFKLVQHFGGVSIITNMVDEPIVEYERNSAEEVYSFIVTELEDVVALLPETPENFGRVSKRAVNHYLAKVYLTRGYEQFGSESDFTAAANYADAAISNQGLNLTYEEVFTPGNENNEEIIFSVQYDAESVIDKFTDGNTQNFWYGCYLGGKGNEEGYPSRSENLAPTMYVFDLYTEFDSRWEASFMNVIYERYYDYFDKPTELDNMVVTQYYPQSWELDDIEDWQAASPLRTDATIFPYTDAWQASKATYIDRETPTVKKFDDPTSVYSYAGSSTRDIFLARLSETYLIAAEAYLKAGDANTALARINVVRSRAAKSGNEAEMQLTLGELDIDKILDERALELLGEYHRWEDLKRTGTLIDRTHQLNRDIKGWFDNGTNPFEGGDGNLKLLRPIPQEALDLNKNKDFPQNPGYE
ncbi:RagB/SusD family nutrient uptake outer membrane protein [Maribellus comscasis]|uniref:RagB/SusD family nutrient uptake outer membrane protein n=1 Tax=Maribellus comscasis TaxID=2681766 RepID=A0A6I6K6B1_9BACT|nr:RagB/SusD family nutrient uptake outer membrane protein [Maribellus comscasis]QGY47183.1 RagB/SusD family nutrient uptake outer membrane protein [Maribellus comscasis]